MYLNEQKIKEIENNRAHAKTGAMCYYPQIASFTSKRGIEHAIEDGNPVFCYTQDGRCRLIEMSLETLLSKIEEQYKVPPRAWKPPV